MNTTTDYEQFKFAYGNREINSTHVKHLIKKFSREGYNKFSIIFVNEKMEIIDGQHRFLACRALGLPIIYQVLPGATFKDSKLLNAGTRSWTPGDYIEAHIVDGNANFVRLMDFCKAYPKLGNVRLACAIIKNRSMGTVNAEIREGFLSITEDEILMAFGFANMIKDFDFLPERIRSIRFYDALVSFMRHPKYVHATMLQKLQYQSTKIRLAPSTYEYWKQFSDIYNYRSQSEYIDFANELLPKSDRWSMKR